MHLGRGAPHCTPLRNARSLAATAGIHREWPARREQRSPRRGAEQEKPQVSRVRTAFLCFSCTAVR
jgi:hypothetical protein